jgi:hypothetical protein
MRWNIFNFDHVAYLEGWSKLERTPLAIDVELDLPLADVDGSSHGLEERPPKDEWWLLLLSPISSTTKSTGMKWCPTFTGTSTTMPKG